MGGRLWGPKELQWGGLGLWIGLGFHTTNGLGSTFQYNINELVKGLIKPGPPKPTS